MPTVFERLKANKKPVEQSAAPEKATPGTKRTVFDVLKQKKQAPQDEEDQRIAQMLAKEEQRHERPIKAVTRGTAEGLMGGTGSLLSLIPGYQGGVPSPAEQTKIAREAALLSPEKEKEFAQAIIAHAADQGEGAPFMGSPPTMGQASKFMEERLDIPKEEHTPIERFGGGFGRSFGGGIATGLPPGVAASTAATGQAGRRGAEMLGLGEKGQAIAEVIFSLRGGKPSVKKAPPTSIKQPRMVVKGKPAEEAGTISAASARSKIEKLDDQAAKLAKDIGKDQKNFQKVSESIKKGHPIDEKFNQFFNGLENITHQLNVPLQDVAPLNNFLSKEARLYQQVGAPTFMGNLINKELRGWAQSGKNDLYSLYRRFRLNNQRLKEIVNDPSFPPAFKKEAIGFFTRMNESITDTFKASLPKDSPWLKTFTSGNEAYSTFRNTQIVRKVLDPLMKGDLTSAQLKKAISNDSFWRSAEGVLGKEDAKKLKTILGDMNTARDAILSIKRSPNLFNTAIKHGLKKSLFGPMLATLTSVPKMIKWGMGQYYASPAFEANIKELALALTEKNIPAINTALQKISESEKNSESKSSSEDLEEE